MKHKTKKLFISLSLVMSMLLLMGLATALAKNEDPKILETSYTADTPGPFAIVGTSPNEKTEAKWVWTHNEKLYIAIIANFKKPLEQVSYDGTTYNSGNTELWQWWIADSFDSPLIINGDPKYIESNKNKDSRWVVIELTNAPLTGSFLLGLDCGPGGFSTWGNEALPVEIDSKLTITKVVQDASGNTSTSPETFDITVSGPEGDKPFEITNGTPLVLTGLLYGEYSVTEQDADNYNVQISDPVTLSMENATGSILITNTVKSYTVIYDANGGQGTLIDTESPYIYNETVTVLANGFTRTGYNFTGWNTAADGSGTAYAADDTFNMPAADVILFGQWGTANDDSATYKVEHYLQGSDFITYSLKETQGLTGIAGETATAMARTYTGYTFDSSAAGTVLSGTIVADGSLVLKLYYTANPYTLSFNANGGEGTVIDTESPYIYNETVTVLANGFTRTGYNFTGWNTAADGSGTAYAAGNTFNMPAADVTLYAQWKSSSGGGSGSGTGSGGGSGSGSGGGSGTVVINPNPPGEDGDGSQTVIVDPIPPTLNKEEHLAYIIGYPENVVRPEHFITREEVATVFYRLLDEDYRTTIKTTVNDFPDVGINRWSSKYIATLANGGIIVGYPDKSFRPQNSITRAEVATIASKFDKLSIMDTNKFSDVSGHWAKGYINSAVEKGWINGYPDNTFKPNQYITRAEFVTLVNNVLERRVHREDILPEAKQFPDLEIESWYYEAMQEAINSHYYNRKADTYEEWLQIYYPDIEM